MIARVLRERGRSWQFPEDYRIGSNRYSKLRDDPSATRLRPNGDETQDAPRYRQAKETKCGEKDCQEVGVPHSSVEAGERALPDPVERRGCRVVDPTPEPRRGHRASQRVTARQWIV